MPAERQAAPFTRVGSPDKEETCQEEQHPYN